MDIRFLQRSTMQSLQSFWDDSDSSDDDDDHFMEAASIVLLAVADNEFVPRAGFNVRDRICFNTHVQNLLVEGQFRNYYRMTL